MIQPTNQLIETLLRYFRGEDLFVGLGLPNLHKNYVWPKKGQFPTYSHLGDIKESYGDNYAKNIALKEQSPGIWKNGEKLAVANWVIADWGGIKSNRPSTVAGYVDAISAGNFPTEKKGVASYSKILSFMDPNEFAIYDARVAISLNAIQLMGRESNGFAFTYLDGRNTMLQKFRDFPSTHFSALLQSGWTSIPANECYTFYLNTLKQVRSQLALAKLYELEMALFADAEKLAARYLGSVEAEQV